MLKSVSKSLKGKTGNWKNESEDVQSDKATETFYQSFLWMSTSDIDQNCSLERISKRYNPNINREQSHDIWQNKSLRRSYFFAFIAEKLSYIFRRLEISIFHHFITSAWTKCNSYSKPKLVLPTVRCRCRCFGLNGDWCDAHSYQLSVQ